MRRKNILIMGAAGRDFHNFNVCFRNNPNYNVVAFTATQIPNIAGRKYPKELAGNLYQDGIPIYDEKNLEFLISKYNIDEVVFSYSDVSHEYIMHKASLVIKAGANFKLLGSNSTMLKSSKPVIAICAVRTGCGKSQTTRKVASILKEMGYKIAIIRHPMPYGDLKKQILQKFNSVEDFKKYNCTIEEIEEYEHHILNGNTVYAGVDYELILREAERETDIILWDGGNNDIPFYKPDLYITIVDPHRANHEVKYFPGEINFIASDVIIINKIDTANPMDIQVVRDNISKYNPDAIVIEAASPIIVNEYKKIKGKNVIVVEDGPTLTHGEMSYGAGKIAAEKYGAKEIIDPRPWLSGKIKETFQKYPNTGNIIPAMGYSGKQIEDLEKTINQIPAELVITGTPIDLSKIIKINKPMVRVYYDIQEIGYPDLKTVIKDFLNKK